MQGRWRNAEAAAAFSIDNSSPSEDSALGSKAGIFQ
jgi:hypothetical protein